MITKFNIIGMSCASCSSHIEEYVSKQNGVINCNVNLLKNNMTVEYDEKIISYNDIIRFVKLAGYSATVYNPSTFNNSNKRNLTKLIISGIILLILMDIAMGHMIKLPLSTFIYNSIINSGYYFLYPLIQIILLIPIIVIYFNIYISGITKLIKLHPNMDSLITIGSIACIVYGIYGLVKICLKDQSYLHNLYFESAGMILVLVNLGKYLESLSKNKSLQACENLINEFPSMVNIKDNDDLKNITINELKVNDVMVIKAGEMIPSDGIIISGEGLINTASITGESKEVFVSQNIKVLSGSFVTEGYLEIKVEELPNDSTFMKIVNLVDECSNSKTRVGRLCDKIALYFVPTVVLISIITFVINYLVHQSFDLAWNYAISVLVISCPCTLGLATPVAVVVSTSKAWRMGVLIKQAQVLEDLHKVDTFVFDKTGTLTLGKFVVKNLKVFDSTYHVLDIVYSLEQKNPHSISKSICEYAKKRYASLLEVTSYEYIMGQGVRGIIDNNDCYVGNLKYLTANNLPIKPDIEKQVSEISTLSGDVPLIVVVNKEVVGLISLQDEIKEEAYPLIDNLNKDNLNTVMLTGDNELTAKTVQNNLKIKTCFSQLLPNDKVNIITKLQEEHTVAMVGDGVNDAPSIIKANVGITVSSASDVSLDVADIVLINNNLSDLYNLIRLSHKTYNIIKGNLFWALFYNVIGIVLATGLLSEFNIKLNPMIASACMSFSSVFVVLNALRINNFKPIDYKNNLNNLTTCEVSIIGMMCEHCEKRINDACLKTSNVKLAEANYHTGMVKISYLNNLNIEELEKNIIQAGYKINK